MLQKHESLHGYLESFSSHTIGDLAYVYGFKSRSDVVPSFVLSKSHTSSTTSNNIPFNARDLKSGDQLYVYLHYQLNMRSPHLNRH